MQDSATATPSAAKVRSEGSSKSLDANPLTSTSIVKSSNPATTAPPGGSQKAGKGNGGEGDSQNSGNAPEEKSEEAAAAMDVEAMLHHRKHHHHHPPPPVRSRNFNTVSLIQCPLTLLRANITKLLLLNSGYDLDALCRCPSRSPLGRRPSEEERRGLRG